MSDTYEYPTPYLAWLVCLFFLLSKIRKEGLFSIEGDIDDPSGEKSIFKDFPQTLKEPYLEFASDLFRMAVDGNLNAKEVSVYAEHAIAGHIEEGQVNIHLLKTIWLTFWVRVHPTPSGMREGVGFKPKWAFMAWVIKAKTLRP